MNLYLRAQPPGKRLEPIVTAPLSKRGKRKHPRCVFYTPIDRIGCEPRDLRELNVTNKIRFVDDNRRSRSDR
jgi:hypothetical protein